MSVRQTTRKSPPSPPPDSDTGRNARLGRPPIPPAADEWEAWRLGSGFVGGALLVLILTVGAYFRAAEDARRDVQSRVCPAALAVADTEADTVRLVTAVPECAPVAWPEIRPRDRPSLDTTPSPGT